MNQVTTFFQSITPKTWLIIGISVLVLILIILWIRSRSKPETKSQTTVVNNTTIVPAGTNDFPLKYGSKGDNVKKLQIYLNSKGCYSIGDAPCLPLVVDGVWGPLTQNAVMKVIKDSSITQAYFDANIK